MYKKIGFLFLIVFSLAGCRQYRFRPDMAYLESAAFLAGKEGWMEVSSPEHTAYVPAFYISRRVITKQDFMVFVKNTGYKKSQLSDFDEGFSYNDAVSFSQWYAKISGKPYRLPTEYEWERAMAANTKRNILKTDSHIKEWCLWEFEAGDYVRRWDNALMETYPLRYISETPSGDFIYNRLPEKPYASKNCSFRLLLPEKERWEKTYEP